MRQGLAVWRAATRPRLPHADVAPASGTIPRRGFLAGALGGAAVLGLGTSSGQAQATPFVAASAGVGTTGATGVVGKTLPGAGPAGRPMQLGPRLAADGLPWASVTGILWGTAFGSILVQSTNANAGPGLTRIVVDQHSTVYAQGVVAQGSADACDNGDELFIGTFIDSFGQRFANYIYANLQTYWGTVASISGNTLECATADYGDAPNSRVSVTLTPSTAFSPGPPSSGDYVYVMAVATRAGVNGPVWATQVLPNNW
jgi:hypothetical protein